MKNNKLFWPIVLVAVIVIAESIIFLSKAEQPVEQIVSEGIEEVTASPVPESVVRFFWNKKSDNEITLMIESQKDLALDARDLEIAYEGVKVSSVTNAGVLPDPTAPKISTENSVIVTHYLISDEDGFKLTQGENVEILNIRFIPLNGQLPVFSINRDKTLVVVSVTSKVLPYSL